MHSLPREKCWRALDDGENGATEAVSLLLVLIILSLPQIF